MSTRSGPPHALVYGAGASLAAPAGRPLFFALRDALFAQLGVALDAEELAWRMAPEALLSRLAGAGIDVDRELRSMLGGGRPNALHLVAVEVLRQGDPVWTTNFDELIETAAAEAGVKIHRLLPGDDAACTCALGHLVKPHGTLSDEHVLARSEDVLAPLPEPWLQRLATDLAGARVAVVGYAGADVDLRTGLATALETTAALTWFGRPSDEGPLRERFGGIDLALSDRPDRAALEWARAERLADGVTPELASRLAEEIRHPTLQATFDADRLLRARVIDDFGRALEGRRQYRSAMLFGPRRRTAGRALYSSGMIHGAPWRLPVVTALNLACGLPLPWTAPHRLRLPYLTWNVEARPRLRALERSLEVVGDDPAVVIVWRPSAARSPSRGRGGGPARRRRLGGWPARHTMDRGAEQMLMAAEVFTAAGSMFAFDALYTELSASPTLAQQLLGLLGLGEVQRARGEGPTAARKALAISDEHAFGFGQVHACVTLGLAGAMDPDEAERRIAAGVFKPPERPDADGLRRFCQDADAERHALCFP